MAERKQVNKYYPPDWRPEHGSLNKFHGTHALRERARKLHKGILIIRFEMPYNIWCDGCGNHIGMGVRYNAEKSKIGKYYSTPIFKFDMKCHLCPNHIVMKTDPQKCDYVIISGAKRKEQKWNLAENDQIVPLDYETRQKLLSDPFYKREHATNDKDICKKATSDINELTFSRSSVWEDDYSANCVLRAQLRAKKSEDATIKKSGRDLALKYGLSLDILPESELDSVQSRSTFAISAGKFKRREESIKSQSVFKGSKIKKAKQLLSKTLGIKAVNTPGNLLSHFQKTASSDASLVKIKNQQSKLKETNSLSALSVYESDSSSS